MPPSPPERAPRIAWWGRARALLRESLSQTDRDYTEVPIRRGLALLAIPMMLEMSMESVFALVDILFVARLGAGAIAAVGLTEAMLTILYAVSIGLAMGVTAMVSRRCGEGDREAAAVVAGQSLWLGALLALLIGVAGATTAPWLLAMMGAEPDVVATGSRYTAILLGGAASILYLFLLSGVFRGAGDATLALRSLWLANGINIVLDPCLIFGLGPFPELGLTGAAVATTIGRSVGVLYQLYKLWSGAGRIRLRARHARPAPSVLATLVRISLGGIGQFLIATSSWVFMIRIVASAGSVPVAGFTVAVRVIDFVFLPAWGMGNAAATLVGQNLGAAKPERAERSAWCAARTNCAFLTAMAACFLAVPGPIVRFFTDDPGVAAAGVASLRTISIGYPLYAIGTVLVQSLNGAGDTATPLVLNFCCFWLLQIPLAWGLAHAFGLGLHGVLWAIVLAESLLTLLVVIVFRRGRWKAAQA